MAKKRNVNYSKEELNLLAEEVQANKVVLFSRQSNTQTNEMKTEAWEAIARKVSALSGVVRTGDRIRAKWHDFQSRTKLKLIEQKKEKRRTGSGPPPPDLTQTEENVLNIIGKTATEGISGGIETSEEVPVAVVSIDRPGLTMDTSDCDTDSNIHSIADSNENGGKFIDSMYPDETEDTVPVLKRGRVSAKTSRSSESGRVTPDVTYLSETEDSGIAKKRSKVSATKSRPSESSITTVENSKYGSILSVENERLKVEQQRLEIEKQKLSVLQSISHSLNQMVGSNVRLSHSSNDDSTIYIAQLLFHSLLCTHKGMCGIGVLIQHQGQPL